LVDILKPFCRFDWQDVQDDSFRPLLGEGNEEGKLEYRAIPLSTKPPPFSSRSLSPGEVQSVAYEIVDESSQERLVVAPDVASITPELLLAMKSADAILFDGTFWSNDEFQNTTGKPRTADDMGHLTVRDGSLKILEGLKARHKIYLHINNTNPILNPKTKERAEVERAGLVVGEDGMEFEL
jgi:pyrroloquinoline quinone biosynthesis protein B